MSYPQVYPQVIHSFSRVIHRVDFRCQIVLVFFINGGRLPNVGKKKDAMTQKKSSYPQGLLLLCNYLVSFFCFFSFFKKRKFGKIAQLQYKNYNNGKRRRKKKRRACGVACESSHGAA